MKDVLKNSIKSHYDREDYTEVVRDALLCLVTEIRRKSDLSDMDGVDLINKAFSEKNPLIKINKLQTKTEKNKQSGITDLSKGLIEYFRNPMSHSKQDYSKKVADAILVLLDEVVLEEILGSKSINSIEDWYLEIANELFPNTDRYAKSLVSTIPKSKYYELAVMLYKNRDKIAKKKDIVINELVGHLTKEEFKEYCEVIESDLFGNINEDSVVSLLKYITPNIWINLSELVRTKLEDMVLEDVQKFSMYYADSEYDIERKNGYLLENSNHILESFSNCKDILNAIADKIADNRNMEYAQEFLLDNYFDLITKKIGVNIGMVDVIYDRMRYSNNPVWYDKTKKIVKSLPIDNEWFIDLAKAFKIEILDEDPFKDIDLKDISDKDLPF